VALFGISPQAHKPEMSNKECFILHQTHRPTNLKKKWKHSYVLFIREKHGSTNHVQGGGGGRGLTHKAKNSVAQAYLGKLETDD
jgi:hypothetical protein